MHIKKYISITIVMLIYIILGILISACIFIFLYASRKKTPPKKDASHAQLVEYINDIMNTGTYYFRVTDVNNNKSIIHNSGINIEDTKHAAYKKFQILKDEINDGIVNHIDTPMIIEYGSHPKKLDTVITLSPEQISGSDDGLCYIVSV